MTEPVSFFRGVGTPTLLAQAPSPVVAMQEKREALRAEFTHINNAIFQYLTTQGDTTTATQDLRATRLRLEDAIKTLTEAIAVMSSDK
jgi:hypothetical protein